MLHILCYSDFLKLHKDPAAESLTDGSLRDKTDIRTTLNQTSICCYSDNNNQNSFNKHLWLCSLFRDVSILNTLTKTVKANFKTSYISSV